jgi:hypothetical protein
MTKSISFHEREQLHFNELLNEISAREEASRDLVRNLRKMSFNDLRSAYNFSKEFGRLSTPKGSTALYLSFSKIKAKGDSGVIARRQEYYLRKADNLETGSSRLDNSNLVADRVDYLEASGKFKKSKADDVQFSLTNMGGTASARRMTATLIENAEKSVKAGGMRRRQVKNAVLMASLIIALPSELTNAQRKELTTEICKPFENVGVFYLAVGHKPSTIGDQRNHHLHLIFSMRPFTSLNETLVFSDKVNRDLQGPRFLKRLRKDIANATNLALEKAKQPRRVFEGTYVQNGLPFAESRVRQAIKVFQKTRRKPINADANIAKDEESSSPEPAEDYIELMSSIVSTVDTRVSQEIKVEQARKVAEIAAANRMAHIDTVMKSLIANGELFALNKETRKLHIALYRGNEFDRLETVANDKRLRIPSVGVDYSVERFVRRLGSRIDEWVAANGPLLMKAWAAKPAHALRALRHLGGSIGFNPSAAISIQPTDKTWDGKGVLSWLADAVRNHGAAEVTNFLVGAPFDPQIARPLPAAISKSTTDIEAYAISLAANGAEKRQSLANARKLIATRKGIKLSLDAMSTCDKAIETDFLQWRTAPFLIQQHRELVRRSQLDDINSRELTVERARFDAALAAVEKAAPVFGVSLRKPLDDLLKSAIDLFGETLWQERLGDHLTVLLQTVRWSPAQAIVYYIEQSAITLPNGSKVPPALLKNLAHAAFENTRMARNSRQRYQEQNDHDLQTR